MSDLFERRHLVAPECRRMYGGYLYSTDGAKLLASDPWHYIRANFSRPTTYFMSRQHATEPARFLYRDRSGKHFLVSVPNTPPRGVNTLDVLTIDQAVNMYDALPEKELPFDEAFPLVELDTAEREVLEQALGTAHNTGYKYDVALTFAGTERDHAEQLASIVRDSGFSVFYDAWYQEDLWGSELPVALGTVYREESRFCVMFVSQEYLERAWTNVERQSAISRTVNERGAGYILPIRVDPLNVPGLPDSIGYLSIETYSIEEISSILLRKLKKAAEYRTRQNSGK